MNVCLRCTRTNPATFKKPPTPVALPSITARARNRSKRRKERGRRSIEMGSEVATKSMNKELTSHLSELRIEGSSITMVDFSDPCPVCGSKKRRCLQPPTRYRKKVLVVEQENDDEENHHHHSIKSPPPPPNHPFSSVSTPEKSTKKTCCCSCSCCSADLPTTPSPVRSTPLFNHSPSFLPPIAGTTSGGSPSAFPKFGGSPFLLPCSSKITPMLPPVGGSMERPAPGSGLVSVKRDGLGSPNSDVKGSDDASAAVTTAISEKENDPKAGAVVAAVEAKKANEGGSEGKRVEKVRVRVSCNCGIRHEFLF